MITVLWGLFLLLGVAAVALGVWAGLGAGGWRLALAGGMLAALAGTVLLAHFWAAVTSVLTLYFAWPAGQVWSNVIASPIVGVTVWGWGHRDRVKLHRKVDAQRAEIVALKKQQAAHHSLIRRHLGIGDHDRSAG